MYPGIIEAEGRGIEAKGLNPNIQRFAHPAKLSGMRIPDQDGRSISRRYVAHVFSTQSMRYRLAYACRQSEKANVPSPVDPVSNLRAK